MPKLPLPIKSDADAEALAAALKPQIMKAISPMFGRRAIPATARRMEILLRRAMKRDPALLPLAGFDPVVSFDETFRPSIVFFARPPAANDRPGPSPEDNSR